MTYRGKIICIFSLKEKFLFFKAQEFITFTCSISSLTEEFVIQHIGNTKTFYVLYAVEFRNIHFMIKVLVVCTSRENYVIS